MAIDEPVGVSRADHATAQPLSWPVDPTDVALRLAAWRRSGTPDERGRLAEIPGSMWQPTTPGEESPPVAFCTEVGRRLLLHQFTYSQWVLRRVEKVRFEDEHRVSRRTTIELMVPPDAPVVCTGPLDGDEKGRWLVPISVMRRRTLVNLDLRDEEGRSISLLGLRFTQKLDESMLRAAALLAVHGAVLPPRLEKFIQQVVSGDFHAVHQARYVEHEKLRAVPGLREYLDDPVFRATLERLWHNFTLYVALPVSLGRHRMLRLGFDEPVDWRLQKGLLRSSEDRDVGGLTYHPFGRRFRWWGRLRVRSGIVATRVRFLTPSAENCASYHFEFTAPSELRIVGARLLAGRPNTPTDGRPAGRISFDGDQGGETIGLHAVEIPNGSLCRTQVDLRVRSGGWLTSLVVACFACTLAVLAVLLHFQRNGLTPRDVNVDEITNIFALLVAVSAGAATYVAHTDTGHVTARMLTFLRAAGVVAVAVPAVLATSLVFSGSGTNLAKLHDVLGFVPDDEDEAWLWLVRALVVLAVLLYAYVQAVWLFSHAAEIRRGRLSAWNITGVGGHGRPLLQHDDPDRHHYLRLARRAGFTSRAVGVLSAEGWHERYSWSDALQSDAVKRLEGSDRPDAMSNPTCCRCGLAH